MKTDVAIIQFQPVFGKPDENISRLDGMFELTGGARIVLLPELASSGYNFRDFDEAYACSEDITRSLFVDFLVQKSRERNTCIVSGINERSGNRLYNSSILVGPEGIMAKYRKIHLFMNEKDIFQPGNGDMAVTDIGGCKVGMLICFDYLFPEIWRAQAMNGADLICHSSNLLTQNAHRCVPGLAIMNRIFILTANRTGTEQGLAFNGQSFITDPSGEVLAKASPDREEVLTAGLVIDQARDKWVTPRNHVFDDRRPELYGRQ